MSKYGCHGAKISVPSDKSAFKTHIKIHIAVKWSYFVDMDVYFGKETVLREIITFLRFLSHFCEGSEGPSLRSLPCCPQQIDWHAFIQKHLNALVIQEKVKWLRGSVGTLFLSREGGVGRCSDLAHVTTWTPTKMLNSFSSHFFSTHSFVLMSQRCPCVLFWVLVVQHSAVSFKTIMVHTQRKIVISGASFDLTWPWFVECKSPLFPCYFFSGESPVNLLVQ